MSPVAPTWEVPFHLPSIHIEARPLEEAVVFARAAPVPNRQVNLQRWTFRHLMKSPVDLMMGGVWSAIWVIEAIAMCGHMSTLYSRVKQAKQEDWSSKIAVAVKNAFVGVVSWVGSSANALFWAHEAKVVILTKFVRALSLIGNGACAFISGVETVSLYLDIRRDVKNILNESNPLIREEHKQHFCYSLLKIVGSVCTIAFGALGVVGVIAGVVIPSALTFPIVCIGGVFSLTAFFYRSHLENTGSFLVETP